MLRGESTGRCVVWIGRPSVEEHFGLIRAGWRTLVADPALCDGDLPECGDSAIAVADLRANQQDALRILSSLRQVHPGIPWIGLTGTPPAMAHATLRQVLAGAFEVIDGPSSLGALRQALARIPGDAELTHDDEPSLLTGSSAAIRALSQNIRKFAPVELPLLITGETGTGKEMAARTLHELSHRRGKPFAAINCGALPANLVQSELFGHERGAFTGATARRIGHFESADGGTVFLDEIGDLPLDAQTNLLRVLQEGTIERIGSCQSIKVDVRVLAATHVDLEKAVAQGRFREDLFYRLNVLRLRMPPLRERMGDIELLAQHFLDAFRESYGTRARTFSAAARRAMNAFPWPGNVRELMNRVQRAAVIADDALISPSDLELDVDASPAMERNSLGSARTSAEREAIVDCLRASSFNISECARRLRVSRVTVYRLCKKHQLALDQLR
ncbi:sigma-54 interaction domain-containing protein [Luteibacter sp. UNCMF366Tsu5.1]|uniref:sigma-54 interaction domain-containing protein n=1 Tax=Luteibacter sp. UNCMF366Tsu5.1 TaxID=1502758 RepID=UPI000908EA67|nr:sigma-54 dependent transcriptional regulator [Luteibacter sp. UNCMF366Tsu5.1]SFW73356.1 DNA-binding transcriptional response regulator, NtrC family, contains REC, AAA-type ATPase, and a Fis-type DNA-binding domains [Luteibacter sp. UNCMF366Tsu5.1]